MVIGGHLWSLTFYHLVFCLFGLLLGWRQFFCFVFFAGLFGLSGPLFIIFGFFLINIVYIIIIKNKNTMYV